MIKEARLTDSDWERFWAKVEKRVCCWNWTASVDGKGYGLFHIKLERRHLLKSHRVTYTLVNGPIPEGLVIDHLCHNVKCVNPDHLEAVTNRENCIRGIQRGDKITQCPKGHKYDEINTYWYKSERGCRECRRENVRRYRQKLRSISVPV